MSNFPPSAEKVAKALDGTPMGDGYLCRCPLLSHGRKRGDIHPSLSVADGERCLLVHCHAGCNTRDVIDELRARGLLDNRRPSSRPKFSAPKEMHLIGPKRDTATYAKTNWECAKPPFGTPVEIYLCNRGNSLPIPAAIRFDTVLLGGEKTPVMIAAVHALDGRVIAVQQTFLTWAGTKAPLATPRKNIGPLGSGAVHLAEAAEIMGLAEGVEDALAAIQLSGIPCWASLGAPRMRRVALPSCVHEVHVFADADDVGRRAAEETAECQNRFGRTVVLRFPPAGHKDWASIVEKRRAG
jgi:hypothetical protein